MTEKLKFVLGMVENNVEKGENAGIQHFLLFLTILSKVFFFRVVISCDCMGKEFSIFSKIL